MPPFLLFFLQAGPEQSFIVPNSLPPSNFNSSIRLQDIQQQQNSASMPLRDSRRNHSRPHILPPKPYPTPHNEVCRSAQTPDRPRFRPGAYLPLPAPLPPAPAGEDENNNGDQDNDHDNNAILIVAPASPPPDAIQQTVAPAQPPPPPPPGCQPIRRRDTLRLLLVRKESTDQVNSDTATPRARTSASTESSASRQRRLSQLLSKLTGRRRSAEDEPLDNVPLWCKAAGQDASLRRDRDDDASGQGMVCV